MEPQVTADYYGILEVPQMVGPHDMKKAYHRLARLRHPDKDGSNTRAKENFQEISEAYETLSDPDKRRQYDAQYPSIQKRKATDSQHNSFRSQNQTKNTSSSNKWSSQPPGPSTTDQPHDTPALRAIRIQIEELEKSLKHNSKQKGIAERSLLTTKKALDEKVNSLETLRAELEKDAREEAARNTWIGYLFGPSLSAEKKEQRSRNLARIRTAMSITEARVDQHKTTCIKVDSQLQQLREKIQQLRDDMSTLGGQYKAEATELQRQRARENDTRAREAEARRRKEEAEAKRSRENEEAEKQRKKEAGERAYRECQMGREEARQKAREANALREKERREEDVAARQREDIQEDARRKLKEEEEKEESKKTIGKKKEIGPIFANVNANTAKPAHEPLSKDRKPGRQRSNKFPTTYGKRFGSKAQPSTQNVRCLHKGWWPQIDGRHLCQRCQILTTKFATYCSTCKLIACSNCRTALKRNL